MATARASFDTVGRDTLLISLLSKAEFLESLPVATTESSVVTLHFVASYRVPASSIFHFPCLTTFFGTNRIGTVCKSGEPLRTHAFCVSDATAFAAGS